jgi:transcriptional regulator with XRE-family HTH domain
MKIEAHLSDGVLLAELGARIAHARLERNLTQAQLAEEAGVSRNTLQRLESGAVAAQLSAFLRVCRVLGLLDRLDALIPEAKPGPMELLQMKGKMRRRASSRKSQEAKRNRPWTWGAQ